MLQQVSAHDVRSNVVLRFVSVALQHHNSIILLMEINNPSSALALARCMVDTCNRGSWCAVFADDAQITQVASGEFEYGNIAIVLDEAYRIGLSKDQRDLLHSFTHTGYEQIANQWSSRGFIEPEFEPKLLSNTVEISGFLLFSLCVHAVVAGRREELLPGLRDAFHVSYSYVIGLS
jgi:hypothetical protein